jgi:hypothetical protein
MAIFKFISPAGSPQLPWIPKAAIKIHNRIAVPLLPRGGVVCNMLILDIVLRDRQGFGFVMTRNPQKRHAGTS